ADEITALLHEAMSIARPKAVFCIAPVEKGEDFVVINDTKIENHFLRVNLEETNRVFPHIATCGTEIHEWFTKIEDPVLKYWADGICEMILGTAAGELRNYIRKHFIPKEVRINTLSPGSLKEWPISAQPALFGIIGNVLEDIGVSLTKSHLMIPFKTISGMFYTSSDNFENCILCPIIKCPNRRAVYDPGYSEKRYGKSPVI
ncbi:MAG: hypothetical protein K0S55_859, partial [Clostridia bacterium]|nr:hypothetical protein [Clostridia bacterium]